MSSIHHKRALRISVDLGAIQHNLEIARASSGGQKLFAVLKADAYGHGALRVAAALDLADGFAVVTLAEAIELREALIDKPILVLQSAHSQSECASFAHYQLWPVIHCVEQVEWFSKLPNSAQLRAWIKIDSGMGRLGFQPNEAQKMLNSDCGLNWFGAMTHFGCADEPQNPMTEQQIHIFHQVTRQLALQTSLANSAGLLAWPTSKAHWARPGIMLYGSNPVLFQSGIDEHLPRNVPLRQAMRVSAPLISRKYYKAGESIGYAASFVCAEPMSIGYVAIGYGDGLPRVLDRTASVFLNGHVCPIVGRVSMDSIAIDLSGAQNAQLGDEAVLWGVEHPVEVMAGAANTITYELMTSIRGQRVYI